MKNPVFVDAAYAADMLHVSPDAVLDLVSTGRLRPYGGRPPNYVFRSADVVTLASAMAPAQTLEAPKRQKSASARVQTRLTADARWADVSDADIRTWVARSDTARLLAARTAATTAMEKLRLILDLLEGNEESGQAL